MNFKAIIFDMDGTLVDSLFVWDVLWEKMGAKFLNDSTFHPSKEDDKAVRTLTLPNAMNLIHKNYNIGKDGAELLCFANDFMFDFYENTVELKAGVRDFLEHLKKNGTKMCIASATAKELIEIAINHCQINDYFSKIFSCGDYNKGKEEPDVFLAARDFLGEKTEDTWVFEDSLIAIKTANKIGMKTVGIFDENNFLQEEIEKNATIYVSKNETLLKLI